VVAQPGRRALDPLAGLPPEWVVLRDVAWPGRAAATIDHVVVGPSGVFVVLVRGRGRAGGRGRSDRTAATPSATSPAVAEAGRATAAIAGRVPFVPRHHVHAVLCAGEATAAPEPVGKVMVVGATSLAATILSHPGSLPPEHTRALASVLRSELSPAAGPARVEDASRAGVVRRAAARGAVVAAGLALVAAVAQPQLVGGLTSAGDRPGATTSQAAGADSGDARDVDSASGTASEDLGAEDVETAEPGAVASASPGAGDSSTDVEVAGEVDAVGEVETPTTPADAEGLGTSPGSVGPDPGVRPSRSGEKRRDHPVAADFVDLVSLLGPRDPAGMVQHVVRLVAAGGLPTLVDVRSTPAPGRLCLQDQRHDVTVTVGAGGGGEVLLLGRGACDRGVALARMVGRPGDYAVDGDERLARGVAAMLTR